MRKIPLKTNETLTFYYINWKGQRGYRTISNPVMWFGNTAYHKEDQWFIKGYDIHKDDIRDFAVLDIIEFVK